MKFIMRHWLWSMRQSILGMLWIYDKLITEHSYFQIQFLEALIKYLCTAIA